MSNWLRGIYNAAANFNMSGSLRAAAGRTMDRDSKHLREERDKPDQHIKSGESSKSNSSIAANTSSGTTCHRNRTTTCTSGTCCYVNTCGHPTSSSSAKDGKLPNPHGASCSCSLCRDYNEYTEYTISASREDVSTWVRVSNEPRNFKQADADSADGVERCTGIPTGVTV